MLHLRIIIICKFGIYNTGLSHTKTVRKQMLHLHCFLLNDDNVKVFSAGCIQIEKFLAAEGQFCSSQIFLEMCG